MVKFKFWGVRGSVPSPGKETNYFGGNTTCISIESNKTFLIVDAGTGIRNINFYLMEKRFKKIYIILTHYHWDHLQGLPFFSPIFNPDIKIEIYGKKNVSEVLSFQMKQPYFPADYKNLPSKIEHKNIPQNFSIEDIFIETIENNHPSGCVGLKFTIKNKKIVFITDNEIMDDKEGITTKKEFAEFIKGSEIFIHDAQYTSKEIGKKRGWGHSTFDDVLGLARMSDSRNIIFTHHDPMRRDKDLKKILDNLRKKNPHLNLKMAKEGMEIKFVGR